MISRYQKIILWLLLVSSVLIAAYLIRMRARAQDRLAAIPDSAPMPIPVEAAPVQVTLLFANDEDGSLAPVEQPFPLPTEITTRARTLLNDLFAEYAKPDSPHPLAPVKAVDEVFLLAVPGSSAAHPQQMAVINLDESFVDHHPSGILVENLTLLSILGTLHANFPQIAQVRFLVDGHPRSTLAGHADLSRTYLTANDVPEAAGSNDPASQAADSSAKQPAESQR
ncbi:MAG TPA: GerMN domain-containing protein [Acidobacteriaceae bacterium]|nr:GerMN domain-containing protein [Acidobacteriaceae bacterium]